MPGSFGCAHGNLAKGEKAFERAQCDRKVSLRAGDFQCRDRRGGPSTAVQLFHLRHAGLFTPDCPSEPVFPAERKERPGGVPFQQRNRQTLVLCRLRSQVILCTTIQPGWNQRKPALP